MQSVALKLFLCVLLLSVDVDVTLIKSYWECFSVYIF